MKLMQLLVLVALCVFGQAQGWPADVAPQSREAWRYAVGEGERYAGLLYTPHEGRLRCLLPTSRAARSAIEDAAAAQQRHPAYLAEMIAVYLWDDWNRLEVPGYDIRWVVAHQEALEPFLEALYQAQQACLLGLLQVLAAGYEGGYRQDADGQYRRVPAGEAEPYMLLALFPEYFPGTGLLEPLGIVYAVRLLELSALSALRQPMLAHVARTLERRARNGDPLKVGP